ncbi:hypothetical protein QAD02_005172 [Eretmocerus hayati]|uniref:Uncharacterized protein n=1 Tax=Eretmocerus hayati TaxID=131215 RepID=A0ACC2NRS6_9HYME|nr:hypothetical protein QAD02_005172 [Eretmocerus hayati]
MNVMSQLYRYLILMYMKKQHVREMKVEDIDPENESEFVETEDIYIGESAEGYLKFWPLFEGPSKLVSEGSTNPDNFRLMCRRFLIKACLRLKNMCDFTPDMRMLLPPNNALKTTVHQQHPTLNCLFTAYPQFESCKIPSVMESINEEWMEPAQYELPEIMKDKLLKSEGSDEFWNLLRSLRDPVSDQLPFKNLSKFGHTILAIPNSNASPERLFSELKDERTFKRLRLSFESTRAVLLSSQ